MSSFARALSARVRLRAELPAPHFRSYLPFVRGKSGLEIGGPSSSFRAKGPLPLYDRLGSLDNCDFSSDTVWANHASEFIFSPNKAPGRHIICDGSQLTPVATASYDFVLSSHNLEHFANPVKALREWKRVLRPGGALILILPFYCDTFDHLRSPTPVAHMLEDFERDTAEDDLTHLPEVLEKHDLGRDPAAGDFDAFKHRSLDNFQNRCLHHHVFDETNSRELLSAVGFDVLTVDLYGYLHLCLLSRV